MEINWSTFLLEIINFLVLVWILKRFLYAPIKKIVLERQAVIQKELKNADVIKKEASDLEKQYEARMQNFEKEKEAKQIELKNEIDAEKIKQIENLKRTLEKEQEKNQELVKKEINDVLAKAKKANLLDGMKFISYLLSQFVSPELEKKIIDVFIDNFHSLSSEKIKGFQDAIGKQNLLVAIKTAFLLDEVYKNKFIELFEKTFAREFNFDFQKDQSLLAGAFIAIGPVIFYLDLKDELKFFAEHLS